MESLVFVALAPIALLLMAGVAHFAWRRRAEPGAEALCAFSLLGAAWLVCDALALLAPTPAATLRLSQAAIVCAPLLTPAWLAFVLAYTEHFSRAARVAVGMMTAWCVVYGGLALTNDAHRLVLSTWQVVPDGSLLRFAYALGPLGWAQTALVWTALMISFGVILLAYAGTGARTRHLSRWIVAGGLVPLALNMTYLLGFGPLEKDFTPLALAVSAGAFALGLARYQFLDLRPIARATLVDDLREGMLVLDARGRIADLNPAMRRILGAPNGLLGQSLADVAPALAEAIAAARAMPFRIGTGSDERHFDLRISPLTDRAGRPSGHLVLLYDVTRRRRERAALGRANAALSAANVELKARNEELDSFGHTVAHDLNNSIQGVLGYAELLRDEGPVLPPDARHVLADDLVGSAHKMSGIVHELMVLAGVSRAPVELRPIPMSAVVDEALDRLRKAKAAPRVAVPLATAWPVALGHAPWVEEVWMNYLGNAAKYGGPTVTLGAEPTASGQVRFWVHDDGPGIPAEAQARLFVPFSRVGPASVQGHGLGLSIVLRIAERLGGACGVESTPGLGTRFWFTLPSAPEGASDASGDADVVSPAAVPERGR